MRSNIAIGVGALLTGLAIGFHGPTEGGRVMVSANSLEKDVSTSRSGRVEGIGYVEPRLEMRRLAFKGGGLLAVCGAKPGDRVRKGEAIAVLDDTSANTTVELMKCRLEVAQAQAAEVKAGVNPHRVRACEIRVETLREQARYWRAEAARLKKLRGSASVSETVYEDTATKALQAESALREQEAELTHLREMVTPEQRAVADAKVRLAVAELLDARQRLADTRLTAPFDGVVLRYLKREGEGASPLMPPEPVVLFGDMTRLQVRAEIDERHAQRLVVGQAAEVYGRNLAGRTFQGSVIEVERAMGAKTVFTRASSERKDLSVLQIVILLGADFNAPVGLQVDVGVRVN